MSDTLLPTFRDTFGGEPTKRPCRFRPSREHQGGSPVLQFEAGQQVETEDFPYEQVFQSLDGERDRASVDMFAAAKGMADMLDWIHEPWTTGTGNEVSTVRMQSFKLNVLLLIIRPQSLGNPVPNLEQLGNRLGTTKQTLSKLTCDFHDRFGVISTWMASDEARKAYSEGKKV